MNAAQTLNEVSTVPDRNSTSVREISPTPYAKTSLRLHLAEPIDAGTDPAREADLEAGADILTLIGITERWGLNKVHGWLKNIAAIEGRDVCPRR